MRWYLRTSLWIAGLALSIGACSQTSTLQAADTALAEIQRAEADTTGTGRLRLLSGTSLRIVPANEKMPWMFEIPTADGANATEEPILTGDPLTLRYSVHRVDQGHKVLSGRREIVALDPDQSQTIALDDQAPTTDGVYEVRFQLVRRSDKLWARLRPKETVLEELCVPMLVQSAQPSATPPATPWQTIGEIRPSDTAMALDTAKALGQWLPDSAVRLIPGVRRVSGDLQKGDAFGESVSILQPKSVFHAKLPTMAIGYPHRITIRCPRGAASSLRVDLGGGADQTQSRFSARIRSRKASLGITNDKQRAGVDDRWLTRTFQYYPSSEDQIWLTNLSETTPVSFESIKVTAGPETQMSLKPRRTAVDENMRTIVLLISDPSWTDATTNDWQANDESASCDPRSIDLYRVWIATHRAVERAQLIGASSIAIPSTVPDALSDRQVAERNTIAMNVFDRFDVAVKTQISMEVDRVKTVALADDPIIHQDLASSLFETIDRLNPTVVTIDDRIAGGIVDDRLWRICKSFQSLPAESIVKISPSDPADGTCRVEHALVDGHALVSITNLAPWDSQVRLQSVSGSNDAFIWERIDDQTMNQMTAFELNQGFVVPFRDTMLFRSRFPVSPGWQDGVKDWRWSASVAGGESVVEQIKKNVTGIVEKMGMLCDPARSGELDNGSFENVGEMGLVGWMHAQHPPGCVVVDSEQASDGKRSIRLTTDPVVLARTWLVSDTIATPASGRLAVSMALRGGTSKDDQLQNRKTQPNSETQHLRVSLEGTQDGVPFRRSADVEVPRSGTWQLRRTVLEVDSLDPRKINSLRLTIDSMTPGQVWIDDIRLHDDFSTTRERTDLQNQAFLAVEGLQRGNLTPSAKLLCNRWAERLLDNSEARAELSDDSDAALPNEDAPEVADRNRGWFLERLRL